MKVLSSKIIAFITVTSVLILILLVGIFYRLGFFTPERQIQGVHTSPEVTVETATATSTSTEVNEPAQPEIAIHEYWDFAKFPNRHVYINNTDRGVVYVLDDAGKIVGTVWGKDYGIEYFEPNIVTKGPRPLLLLRDNENNGDIRKGTVVIVDPLTGTVLWHRVFPGYFDGPQMEVLSDGTWIMEYYGGATSGVHVYGVDSGTGAVKWEINRPDFYGIYWDSYGVPKGQFIVRSGGVGWGDWNFTYAVQAEQSSTTPAGTIISRVVSISDQQGGFDTTLVPMDLVLFPDQKRMTLIDKPYYDYKEWSTEDEKWSVTPGDRLYDVVTSRTPGATRVSIYPTYIVAEYRKDGVGSYPVWDVFSTQTGEFLWRKDFTGTGYYLTKIGELDGVIVTTQEKISGCDMCRTEKCSGWICVDGHRPKSDACMQCRQEEENDPSYINTRYQAFNGKTGAVLWSYGSKFLGYGTFNAGKKRIEFEGNGQVLFLDPHTGTVVGSEPLVR